LDLVNNELVSVGRKNWLHSVAEAVTLFILEVKIRVGVSGGRVIPEEAGIGGGLAVNGARGPTTIKGWAIALLPNGKVMFPPLIEELAQPGYLERAERPISKTRQSRFPGPGKEPL
jgi:hypothetical protein